VALAKPRLRVSVRPRSIRRGRLVRLRLRVTTTGGKAVRGARVRIAGRRSARTNSRGTTTLRVRIRRGGRVRVQAFLKGTRSARGTLLVRRR